MIMSGIAQMLLIGGLFLVLCAPAFVRGRQLWLALLLCILSMLDWAALFQFFLFHVKIPGAHWNWTGKLIDLSVLAAVGGLMIGSATFKAADLGLTFHQAPGTVRAFFAVMLPFLLVVTAVSYLALFGQPGPPPDGQAIVFQATLPGLSEELAYRGIFLAILDRMFPNSVRVFGANVGYGALASSVVFAVLHGVSFDPQLRMNFEAVGFLTAGVTGLVLCWIRARTGSLVLPVMIHNATNLILIFVRPA